MRNFVRVSRLSPCPICGKGDWCMVSADGSVAICPRVPENSKQYLGEAGYLHELEPGAAKCFVERKVVKPEPEVMLNAPMVARWLTACATVKQIENEAQTLGVDYYSLVALSIGWSAEHIAFSFPMRDSDGSVIGIRLRRTDGHKWAIRGSRNGLFLPNMMFVSHKPLLVCEGPTDTAAMVSLGFQCIGRPFCRGGVEDTVRFCSRVGSTVVIVSDLDGPGMSGAQQLAHALSDDVQVKIIYPMRGKDARAWKRFGASFNLVNSVIDNASVWSEP